MKTPKRARDFEPATSQQRPNAHERASGKSFAARTFIHWFVRAVFSLLLSGPSRRSVPATSQQRPNAHERASGKSSAPSTLLNWFVCAVLRAHAISC